MTKNNKITLFIPSLAGGGAERHAVNLLNAMVNKVASVDLVVAGRVGELGHLLDKRVNIIELNAPSVSRSLFALIRYLYRAKPLALFSLLDHANLVAWFALSLSRVKTQFFPSAHGDGVLSVKASNAKGLKSVLLFWMIKTIYRFFPIIIAVSKGSRNDVIRYTHICPNRVVVIYNAILHDAIYQLALEDVSHKWFQDRDSPLLIAAGRLSPEKNFPLLIDALYQLNKKMALRLIIFGQGPQKEKLQHQIDQLGMSHCILLYGFDSNIYKYLKRCDLFVLSSQSESLSCILVEALALAPDVVSTDCLFGPSEVLEDGKYGYLVKNNDVAALTQGIMNALQKTQSFPQKNQALKRFDSNAVADQYLQLIHDD